MPSGKTPDNAELAALASEVMDLWQEHLALYAADPKAKDELMRLIEPQRRLFADWAAMMQNGQNDKHGTSGAAAARATAAAASSDDGALRLAQLAHRTAQLERRVDELERRLAGSGHASAKTRRPSKPAGS